jgi:hypothetical protein
MFGNAGGAEDERTIHVNAPMRPAVIVIAKLEKQFRLSTLRNR